MNCWFLRHARAGVIEYGDLPSFLGGTGALTLETFDAAPWAPPNTVLPQPVVNLGVSWTASERLFVLVTLSVSGLQSITSSDEGGITDALVGVLPAGITAVGGWVANAGGGNDVELTAFDAVGGVIGTVVAPLAPLHIGDFRFVGITSDVTPIASAEFRSLQGEQDDFALDDFYFGDVPEPATLSLFALGGLLVTRRRR